MINILGGKRIITLLALLAINVVLVATWLMYLTPSKIQAERDLAGLKSNINTARSEISLMQSQYQDLTRLQERFDVIKDDGFFNLQRRRDAEEMLQEVQDRSGVIAASVKLSPGKSSDDIGDNQTDYLLLESSMEITLDALDDADVFRYIFYIQEYFPGHISIESVDLKRENDLSVDLLKSITNKQNPKMVGAVVDLVWRTMIPKSEYTSEDKG